MCARACLCLCEMHWARAFECGYVCGCMCVCVLLCFHTFLLSQRTLSLSLAHRHGSLKQVHVTISSQKLLPPPRVPHTSSPILSSSCSASSCSVFPPSQVAIMNNASTRKLLGLPPLKRVASAFNAQAIKNQIDASFPEHAGGKQKEALQGDAAGRQHKTNVPLDSPNKH